MLDTKTGARFTYWGSTDPWFYIDSYETLQKVVKAMNCELETITDPISFVEKHNIYYMEPSWDKHGTRSTKYEKEILLQDFKIGDWMRCTNWEDDFGPYIHKSITSFSEVIKQHEIMLEKFKEAAEELNPTPYNYT